MKFLLRLLTWWDGRTIGTQLFTWRHGKLVGQDDQGNLYYENADATKRWVIYNGACDASRVPSDWHGWLHHTFSERPGAGELAHKPWEKEHQDNMTGTDLAYVPAGSLRSQKPVTRQDYEAWQPE